MNWLLVYAIVCWIIGLCFAGAVMRWSFTKPNTSCAAATLPTWALVFLPVIMAPIWVPIAVVLVALRFVQCLSGVRKLVKVSKQYREPMFQPLSSDALEITAMFEDFTPDFVEAGFVQLQDFHNKPEPVHTYNRYFLGVDGTVFGDLSVLLGECGVGLFSVLADGTYIETAAVDPLPGDLPNDDDRVFVVYGGTRSVSELVELHMETVRAEADRRRTSVFSFRACDVREVSIYGNRVFSKWRQRLGEITDSIPEPVIPTGAPLQPSRLEAVLACAAV
jgi:hypothetical protein